MVNKIVNKVVFLGKICAIIQKESGEKGNQSIKVLHAQEFDAIEG